MNSLAKKDIVVENNLILESNGHFKYESYINFLSEIGYARVSTVNHLGEFSVKGDIIDIFPSEYKEPVRLSIFGDTIESISTFDLKTKLNKDSLNRVVVKPHDEKNFNKRKREISANTFLTDISSFDIDDLIVHVDHGIGQFQGLKTLNILDSEHDCIEIRYQNLSPDSYTIYDINGRKIKSKQIDYDSDLMIDVSRFEKGMYFISLEINEGVINLKFLVK